MEPVRTKRFVVLAIVFLATTAFMLGCGRQSGDAEAEAAKSPAASGSVEKTAVKPEQTTNASDESAVELEKSSTSDIAAPPAEGGKQDLAVSADSQSESQQVKGPLGDPLTKDAEQPLESPTSDSEADDAAQLDDDYGFEQPETAAETARRLGPPLVEQPDKLERLDEVDSIWIDKPGGRLVMVGEVCQRQAPLEMFVCLWRTKEHEAVLTARVPAIAAHAGLLALGAKAGRPVQFMPEYVPASGSVIDVEVVWKDADGNIQRSRGQDWIRDYKTRKAMEHDWVFAGSGFWTDEETGKKYYQAQSGDFICVSNFSTAMLDLPIESSQQNEALMFEAFTERIPPLGTPVTIILKPRLDAAPK